MKKVFKVEVWSFKYFLTLINISFTVDEIANALIHVTNY